MKLYAKVTSDRASKGQGGNKQIVIDLMAGSAEDSRIVAIVSLVKQGDLNRLELMVEGRSVYLAMLDEKGNKQKTL